MNTCLQSLVSLKGSNLHVGPHIVALHGRKKTKALVEAMLKPGESDGLEREQLKQEVYANASLSLSKPSARLRESQDGSLSKLISRSRNFLKESLRDTVWSNEVDWFVYSDKNRRWQLVRNRA